MERLYHCEKALKKEDERIYPNYNKIKCEKKCFSDYKENTFNSLFEVENFLRSFTRVKSFFKFYKTLK